MTKGTSLDHRRRKGRGTARPFKKIETTATDDEIFESLIETFPASDPPAWIVLARIGNPKRQPSPGALEKQDISDRFNIDKPPSNLLDKYPVADRGPVQRRDAPRS